MVLPCFADHIHIAERGTTIPVMGWDGMYEHTTQFSVLYSSVVTTHGPYTMKAV